MVSHPAHFETLDTWVAARERLGVQPLVPRDTAGRTLETLALFVRDHRHREVPPARQSLEAHYGTFVFTQSRPGPDEARRLVREVAYGAEGITDAVGGHEARRYELGPEPDAGDPDPRPPAVIVWVDDARFFLLASDQLPAARLHRIAVSMYGAAQGRGE